MKWTSGFGRRHSAATPSSSCAGRTVSFASVGKPWVTARGVFRCKECDGSPSLAAGTVFQDTHKPLRTWFLAMGFITRQKNGMSALGLQRALGLGRYETAWTWRHKLRRAMVRPGRDRLTGEIEVDETYVGGPEEGKRGREIEKKSIVVVAAEKNGRAIGRIRLKCVKDFSAESLLDFIMVWTSARIMALPISLHITHLALKILF